MYQDYYEFPTTNNTDDANVSMSEGMTAVPFGERLHNLRDGRPTYSKNKQLLLRISI